ncbi:hypothetical protein GCM10010304_54100 [Streptomyces roseoviolaceus]
MKPAGRPGDRRQMVGRRERQGDTLTVTAAVPPNITALVELPDGKPPFEAGSGSHTFTVEASRRPRGRRCRSGTRSPRRRRSRRRADGARPRNSRCTGGSDR